MSEKTIPEYLNRFTTLPFLLDVLQNSVLTLVDFQKWEDKNDVFYMDLYKKYSEYKSVLALCFSGWSGRNAEKYHIWRTYSGSTSGVCIQFKRDKLISRLDSYGEKIRYGMVDYFSIKKLRTKYKGKRMKELPFMKRLAYDCDSEFRIIYSSSEEDRQTFPIKIDFSCISKITLNPWILEPIDKSVKMFFSEIEKYHGVEFTNTTVLEYEEWKKYGKLIADGERNV